MAIVEPQHAHIAKDEPHAEDGRDDRQQLVEERDQGRDDESDDPERRDERHPVAPRAPALGRQERRAAQGLHVEVLAGDVDAENAGDEDGDEGEGVRGNGDAAHGHGQCGESEAQQGDFASKDLARSYEVDAFAAQHAAKDGDYVEFRSMGWIQAGLVGTAEVSPSLRLRVAPSEKCWGSKEKSAGF